MKKTNLVTPKVLKNISDINDMCQRMHLPPPPVQFIDALVLDENGKPIEQYTSKSNSYVRNAYNFLAQNMLPAAVNAGTNTFGAGGLRMKSTSGLNEGPAGQILGPFNGNLSSALLSAFQGDASANYGIIIGTSDAAESFEDHNLQAKIAHGTSAGQMTYMAGNVPSVAYNSGTKKWTSIMSRVFANNSGSEIIVKEVGMVMAGRFDAYSYLFLLSRDLLASPVAVQYGQTLTITYTTEITFPG